MEKYSNHSQIMNLFRQKERLILENRNAMNQLAIEFPNKYKSKKSNAYKEYATNYKQKEALLVANFYKELERIGNEIDKLITEI